MRTPNPNIAILGIALASLSFLANPVCAQERVNRANYKLAEKYSSKFLRQFSYSTSISPRWIGKSNRFWYSYRTSAGTRYWYIDADTRTKQPLFDHQVVAGAITEATEKAVDAARLSLGSVKFEKGADKFKFTAGGFQFEYDRTTASVKKLGKVPRSSRTGRTRRGMGSGNLTREEMIRRMRERREREEEDEKQEEDNKQEDEKKEDEEDQRRGRSGRSSGGSDPRSPRSNGRSYSPDRTAYVYAKEHNLYFVKGTKIKERITKSTKGGAKKDDKNVVEATMAKGTGKVGTTDGATKSTVNGKKENAVKTASSNGDTPTEKQPSKPRRPRFRYDTKSAVQLSKDGVKDYSFGGAARSRATRNTTRSTRNRRGRRGRRGTSRVSWSSNSEAFYTTRRDSRGVGELFLVNSVADPRPTLQSYKYSMPGEEKVRTSELNYFHRTAKTLTRIKPKWKQESYQNVHWRKGAMELRFLRRDRLLRHIELCALDPKTGKIKVLLTEGAKDGYLKYQSVRYLEKRKEFIWWSERAGWGHYYLYDTDGKLKNAITKGAFRASRIVSVDEDQGWLYFRGNGREQDENIYYEHLYRVRLDGTGLTLLDPGNANHRSSLSPSKRFVVDNSSRVDAVPSSVLRDAEGNIVMKLEMTDLVRLDEIGWKMPETFVVKAADGMTDLYGNMWKPFDFDAKKQYPVILSVYPGPQQEGVSHTFSANNSRQQLAQLGFIVIQVGHRGGTPKRSRAYANYGYYNLRDYGLADKKAAVEQLAMRFSFIDVERVGMYGHSGGGFMTAAAMMQKPYNEFFKVGVSSSGNHDNNIYNNSWSERYHGLKEVAVEQKKKAKEEKKEATGSSTESGTGGQRRGRSGQGRFRGRGGRRNRTGGRRTGRRRGTGGTTSEVGKSDKGELDAGKTGAKKTTANKKDTKKSVSKKSTGKKGTDKDKKMKFEIKVPTNAELAENLVGHLLLVHGEIDNNVHPANTMRLVDALIKANKRFDMLIIPGARHGYGRARSYFTHRMWEYFAEHLLGDRQQGADIMKKAKRSER